MSTDITLNGYHLRSTSLQTNTETNEAITTYTCFCFVFLSFVCLSDHILSNCAAFVTRKAITFCQKLKRLIYSCSTFIGQVSLPYIRQVAYTLPFSFNENRFPVRMGKYSQNFFKSSTGIRGLMRGMATLPTLPKVTRSY